MSLSRDNFDSNSVYRLVNKGYTTSTGIKTSIQQQIDNLTSASANYVPITNRGKVLQVVSKAKTDTFTTSSNSWVDITGLSIDITPSASTSKILIMSVISATTDGTDPAPIRLLRGSIPIIIGDSAQSRTLTTILMPGAYSNANGPSNASLTHLDIPLTNSLITYKLQTIRPSGGIVYLNRGTTDSTAPNTYRTTSSITAIEIGA